jgi:propionyl-CoA carboxylase alpha chain
LALDQYILRGVQHNVPFCRDVLRNNHFVKGYTPTGFIGQHYPDGFSGGRLSEKEICELVVIAREIGKKRCMSMESPPMVLTGSGGGEGTDEAIVCLGGMFGDAYLVQSRIDLERDCSITASVTKLPCADSGERSENDGSKAAQAVVLCKVDHDPADDLALVSLPGEERALQVSMLLTRRSISLLVCY